ncbi:partial Putative asparagine synthetase [glutamine-hydrolyzing], partial [Burkholderiales bacterium]
DLNTFASLNNPAHSLHLHSTRLAISALEMGWYMRHQLLRDTDWASMAHSLEIRVPYVDLALLKAIAPWLAAHPDLAKSQVAGTLAPQIPAQLLHKPKTGFSIPVREWLLQGHPELQVRGMRGWARHVLADYWARPT